MSETIDLWLLDDTARDEWPDDEEFATTMFDAISDPFYVVDRRGRFVDWNDRFREVTGYAPVEIERLDPMAIIAEEDRPTITRALTAVAEGGERTVEAVLVTKDGERIPHEFSASPLFDAQGGIWGLAGIARDVSDQHERERLLRALHESTRELMAAETKQAVAEAAARVAQEHFAFASTEVRLLDDEGTLVPAATAGERPGERTSPRETSERLLDRAYERGAPIVYDDLATVDAGAFGDDRSVLLLPIPGHGLLSIVATEPAAFDELDRELGRLFAADVESAFERADREERLRARERELSEYEMLVETMHAGVYLTDEDSYIRRVNDALVDLLGIERTELVGTHVSTFGDETALREVQRMRDEILAGERTVGRLELEVERGDGELITIDNRFALLAGDGEQFRGSVGVVRDVTDQKEREEALKERRDELDRLNRINELVRETIRALTSTATREEMEATVCERLADSEFYKFAWIGARAPDSGRVEPRNWAGDGREYLDAVTVTDGQDATGQGPGGRALRTGDVHAVADVQRDPTFGPWRDHALEHGFRSCAVVPLTHGKTVHGILAVYAGRPEAFSRRELDAFEVLGEMVGFAISATQNRRLIEADTTLELELELRDAESGLPRLSTLLDCPCRLDGVVATADEGMLHYVTVTGADGETILETLRGDETDAAAPRLVREDGEESVVEVRLAESLPARLLESGVRPVDVVAEGGTTRVLAEAPRDVDIRAMMDRLEGAHDDISLVAKREVEREDTGARDRPGTLSAELTDRQQSALSAAYYGGYFDWPRDSTAEDVADSLGIASATLHQHLRRAQRKLLQAYFEDGSELGDT